MEDNGIKRIRLLDVPVDCSDQETTIRAVEGFLLDGGRHQIVFLDRRNLFKARRDLEFRRCLREASLVLPVAGSLVRGARFLKEGKLTRYNAFSFVIRLLALAERLNRTVYLLGARKEELERAEKNLRDSFPGLRLVGRFAGFFPQQIESKILLAIRKAAPSFLLVGNGLPAKELWILRRKQELNPGIYLWIRDCFDLFSGKKRAGSRKLSAGILLRPWRIFLIIPLLYYWVLVLIYKLFKL